jgi:hypothetical protein
VLVDAQKSPATIAEGIWAVVTQRIDPAAAALAIEDASR